MSRDRAGAQHEAELRRDCDVGERLDGFDFAQRPVPATERYPWRQWTDGSVWRVERGQDYEVASRHLQAALYARATRDGLRVRTRLVRDGDREAVVFQFTERFGRGRGW